MRLHRRNTRGLVQSDAQGFRLASRVDWTCSVLAGVNQHQYISQTTISDIDGATSLGFKVNDHVSLSPRFVEMAGHRSLFGPPRIHDEDVAEPGSGQLRSGSGFRSRPTPSVRSPAASTTAPANDR